MTVSKPTQQVGVKPGKASGKPVPLEIWKSKTTEPVREWPSQRVAAQSQGMFSFLIKFLPLDCFPVPASSGGRGGRAVQL